MINTLPGRRDNADQLSEAGGAAERAQDPVPAQGAHPTTGTVSQPPP